MEVGAGVADGEERYRGVGHTKRLRVVANRLVDRYGRQAILTMCWRKRDNNVLKTPGLCVTLATNQTGHSDQDRAEQKDAGWFGNVAAHRQVGIEYRREAATFGINEGEGLRTRCAGVRASCGGEGLRAGRRQYDIPGSRATNIHGHAVIRTHRELLPVDETRCSGELENRAARGIGGPARARRATAEVRAIR